MRQYLYVSIYAHTYAILYTILYYAQISSGVSLHLSPTRSHDFNSLTHWTFSRIWVWYSQLCESNRRRRRQSVRRLFSNDSSCKYRDTCLGTSTSLKFNASVSRTNSFYVALNISNRVSFSSWTRDELEQGDARLCLLPTTWRRRDFRCKKVNDETNEKRFFGISSII